MVVVLRLVWRGRYVDLLWTGGRGGRRGKGKREKEGEERFGAVDRALANLKGSRRLVVRQDAD